jgi:hypothetical protein
MTSLIAHCIEVSNEETHNFLYYVLSTGLRSDNTKLETILVSSFYTP